jgi:hypothetical protein
METIFADAMRDRLDELIAAISDLAGDPGPAGHFTYRGDASIEHLNTRKVGEEEPRSLEVDVKFQIRTDATTVLQFADPTLLAAMFLPGGAARSAVMGPVTFTHVLEDYRIDALGSVFGGVRLKKFAVTPRDSYQAEITFVASFAPSADEVARLAEYLADDVHVAIEPTNHELDIRGAA